MKTCSLFILLSCCFATHAGTSDDSYRFCRSALKQAGASELLTDLDTILEVKEEGVQIDEKKFATMKRVSIEHSQQTATITRIDGPVWREIVSVTKVNDTPAIYDITDADRKQNLTTFYKTASFRLQYFNGLCIPFEIKSLRGPETGRWKTVFNLTDCIKDKSKKCGLNISGFLQDPRVKEAAARPTQFSESNTGHDDGPG